MLGNFHDDVINIECETNSADLYVVDKKGVYIENIAMHSYLESDVIDAINAKYGTNFTHLTMQKVTGIAIGDDCPNWNAYEKIRMNNMKVAVDVGTGGYVLGLVNNGIFTMCVVQNGNAIIINQDGRVVNTQASAQVMFEGYAKNVLVEQGFQINGFQTEVVEVSQGDFFPNYQDYLFIP